MTKKAINTDLKPLVGKPFNGIGLQAKQPQQANVPRTERDSVRSVRLCFRWIPLLTLGFPLEVHKVSAGFSDAILGLCVL